MELIYVQMELSSAEHIILSICQNDDADDERQKSSTSGVSPLRLALFLDRRGFFLDHDFRRILLLPLFPVS
ncbi:hypothetical protein MLD38_025354 [Melastoma candidum]|uniref:Uncharacterized protein n=1 Tax=Melastoma candidum TaxID=119954 RepID=A0ACB9NUT7_9MYRT|nr:hypothetical protein MLD38_025354 [Melastoma candidum]